MTRQILVSTPPAPPPPGGDSGDFGRWLTHELRAKGAPKESRPPAPIELPPPDAADAKQEEFARWLTTDLRPRNSSVPPPDSLAPQLLPEADVPTAVPPPDLDDDDLSVLPARATPLAWIGGRERRRSLVVLGVVLLAFGFFLMRGNKPMAEPTDGAAAAEASGIAAALPPPPPEELPLESEPLLVEEEATARARRPAADDAAMDPADPRWRLGGPSIGRFPDLPLPTLSRLAKETLERTRERDAAVRKAAKTKEP